MGEAVRYAAVHGVWPGLLIAEREDGSLTLHNAEHGTSIDVEETSRALVEVAIDAFATPRTLSDFLAAHEDFPEELLIVLVRSGLVVEVDELPFLAHGFLRPTTTPVGPLWSWSDLPELAYPGGWVVLGAPVDAHALGLAGARHGPSEIRKLVSSSIMSGEGDVLDHELGRLYPALQVPVSDLGDVDPEGGRMDHFGSRLRKVVRELLAHDMRPLVLGGDHSVTHYVLAELLARGERFGVIHFDAHSDLLPSRSLSHANVFREALDRSEVTQLVQIGLRVMERVSPYARRVTCPKRTVVTAREALLGRAHEVIAALPRDIPYYLSFDIDCIDGALARETGTPSLGGLSFSLCSELVDTIARELPLCGADIMEVSGAQTPLHVAATMAASLVQRCLLGGCAFEPLTTDVYALPER